jgi:DNA-binding transcriptional regulator/RsmH inhibitor MraZ
LTIFTLRSNIKIHNYATDTTNLTNALLESASQKAGSQKRVPQVPKTGKSKVTLHNDRGVIGNSSREDTDETGRVTITQSLCQ